MRKVELGPGAVVRFEDGTYELVVEHDVDGVLHWQAKSLATGIVMPRRSDEVRRAYDQGEATLDSRLEPETEEERRRRRRNHGVPLSDMPKPAQMRIRYRKGVIREVQRRIAPGSAHAVVAWVERKGKMRPVTALDRICAEVGSEQGIEVYGTPKPCSAASYYRWLSILGEHEDQRDLRGDFDKRGRTPQVDPLVTAAIKRVMARLLEASKYRRQVGGKAVLTMREIMDASLKEVKVERLRHPERPLKLPDRSTFYVYYNQFPAQLRNIAKYGATRARAMHRGPGEGGAPEAALSHLQFDETRLPLFVVHDTLGIPLGRPWLAILVDVYSNCIVGFYIGFEPPGDLVLSATMRHGCLMKSYVAEKYPDIRNPYLAGGVGRFYTFDNSLQAHGDSILQITSDLDVPYDFTPPRCPWVKGEVEGAFAVANQTFLQEMPGYVLSRELKLDKHDYDPTVNAVIGLRHLLWLWHHWLLDVYHANAPRNGMRMSPNERWLEGTRRVKPAFIERGMDLDFLFGIVREGRRLDNRGVVYEGLYYYSDGVDILRRRRGAKLLVKVKVNPLNLSKVHVWDPDEEIWIPAYARDLAYTEDLDLHRHTLQRRHSDRLSGRDDLEGWIESQAHLQSLIASSAQDALGTGIQSKIARAMGLGTPRVFATLDHDGRLPVLVDPTGRPALPPPAAEAGRPASPPAIGAGPTRRREIPVFRSNKSLGQS